MIQIVHPEGPCRVLVADPPWKFNDTLPKGRHAGAHYRVATLSDIQRFPLPEFTESAALFLWCVDAMPDEALQVARAWGFEPKAAITWVKTSGAKYKDGGKPVLDEDGFPALHIGMGHYTRAATERALICTRGRFEVADKGVRNVVFAPLPLGEPGDEDEGKKKHSAKPDKFFRIVERLCGRGPYVELFARRPRAGWLVVGDEIPALPDDDRPAGTMRTLWTPRGEVTVGVDLAAGDDESVAVITRGGEATHVAIDLDAQGGAVKAAGTIARKFSAEEAAAGLAAAAWADAALRCRDEEEVALVNEGVIPPPDLPTAEQVVADIGAAADKVCEGVKAAVTAAAQRATKKPDPERDERARRGAYVERAIREGLLKQTDVAREGAEGAWVKLQFIAPREWFSKTADSPAKPLALEPAAGTGDEVPFTDIAGALAKLGIRTDVPLIAALAPDVRRTIVAWVNTGARPEEAPDALAALTPPTSFAGCSACDRGEPHVNGTAYLHTGTGPLCASTRPEAATAAPKTDRAAKAREAAARAREAKKKAGAGWETARAHLAANPPVPDEDDLDEVGA